MSGDYRGLKTSVMHDSFSPLDEAEGSSSRLHVDNFDNMRHREPTRTDISKNNNTIRQAGKVKVCCNQSISH